MKAGYDREIATMEMLTAKKCPYIIKLYGHCGDVKQPTSRFIALEYLGGDSV